MATSNGEQSEKLTPQNYAGYGSKAFPKWLRNRTAEKQAAFFLPHLRSGMSLLDCGSGPGSITLGLANAVAPGSVVGIDIDASQTEMAQNLAVEHNVSNVRFETATAYELPFPDQSFDAVFSNAVLGHLDNPLVALRELYRVLKVGGVAGIRVADNDGQIFSPRHPLLTRSLRLLGEILRQLGGNASLGKEVRGLMHQAGFVNTSASASYESYGTEEATRSWGTIWSQALQEENNVQRYIEVGAERAEIESIRKAWEEWSNNPAAFFADSYCEVVGRKQ